METLQPQPRNWAIPHWWCCYLAWLASTPRNSIEIELEPNRHDPHDRIRVIDTHDRVGTEYPTINKKVWWTIICLDGAPERMEYLINLGRPVFLAALEVAPAEERFITLITDLAEEPTILIQPTEPLRDGVILGFETLLTAVSFAHRVRQECQAINEQEQLPWTEQFHPRVGIGLSVRKAFTQLLHARRNQIRYEIPLEGESLLGGSEEEIQALVDAE